MKTYNQIRFSQISEILMQAALGVSAVCGFKYVTSDMVYSLYDARTQDTKVPYYIAIESEVLKAETRNTASNAAKVLAILLLLQRLRKTRFATTT